MGFGTEWLNLATPVHSDQRKLRTLHGSSTIYASPRLARPVLLRERIVPQPSNGEYMMKKPIGSAFLSILLALLGATGVAFAQDQPYTPPPDQQGDSGQTGGWKRVGEPQNASQDPNYSPGYSQERNGDPNAQQSPEPNAPPASPVPPQLTIKAGTFVTVRLNQALSSDKSHVGDSFTATLVRPLVVDGVVAAQPGETVGGRVTNAEKAGRVQGVSQLGIQLTDLTLADGQQMPIQSQFLNSTAGTSRGRDAGAIGGTTALGAAVGAAAADGYGAGLGAAAGAAASTIGVLLTRGHATVLYPESVLTFRIVAPVTFSTDRSPQAFRYVEPDDYRQTYAAQQPPPPARQPSYCGPYGCPPPPLYGPPYYGPAYYYGPGYYPYYWGPQFSFFYGRGFYGGRVFYGGSRRFGGYRR
jgi:hypothetical protein